MPVEKGVIFYEPNKGTVFGVLFIYFLDMECFFNAAIVFVAIS